MLAKAACRKLDSLELRDPSFGSSVYVEYCAPSKSPLFRSSNGGIPASFNAGNPQEDKGMANGGKDTWSGPPEAAKADGCGDGTVAFEARAAVFAGVNSALFLKYGRSEVKL